MTTINEGRTKLHAEPVYLFEIELKNSGPTLYFSDRNITVGGQRYENYIDTSLVKIKNEVKRMTSEGKNASIPLKFYNEKYAAHTHLIEIDDTYPFVGSTVTVKEFYIINGTPSDTETIYKGILEEPVNITIATFECTLSSLIYAKDKTFDQPVINLTDYADAFEDLGKYEPFVYGDDILIPSLKTDWGAQTTLAVEIDDSQTGSIELSDSSRFPASGAVIIDEEEISYASISSDVLQGATRGASSTTKRKHRAGGTIWEKQTNYDSLLSTHELDAVGTIYAEIDGKLHKVKSGVTATVISGKHYLRATSQIRVDDEDGIKNTFSQSQSQISRKASNLPFQRNGGATGPFNITFPAAPSTSLDNVKTNISFNIYRDNGSAPSTQMFLSISSNATSATDVDGHLLTKIYTLTTNTNSDIQHMPNSITIANSSWKTSQGFYLSHPSTLVWISVVDANQVADVTGDFTGDPGGGNISYEATDIPVQASTTTSIQVHFPAAPSTGLQNVYSQLTWDYGLDNNATFPSSVVLQASTEELAGISSVIFGNQSGTSTESAFKNIFGNNVIISYGTAWQSTQTVAINHGSSGVAWASGLSWSITGATMNAISPDESSVNKTEYVNTREVERFHAVVDGYGDPDGNYGGAGNLIERPDYVIKHFLVEVLGYSLADDIDSTSFNDAGTSYAAAISGGYKFAFIINKKITPSQFLKKLAFECRSVLKFEKGKWYLDYLPDTAPSVDKTIANTELAGEETKFEFSRTSIDDLQNDITANFKRNYTRVRDNSEWAGVAEDTDATSITKYGTYKGVYNFEAIRIQLMADDVVDHIILQRKNTLLITSFPLFYEHFDLELGKTVQITNNLYNNKTLFIEEIMRNKGIAEIRAIEWY
ncbi:MAG: hypothetical protein GY782_08570 [Gammaproteobacteria bacterium]|nr:hypothetical protein [Gammaproteobacteria bacterium]